MTNSLHPTRAGDSVRAHGGARAGFTVVEDTVMATILVVGVLGMVGAVICGVRLVAVNREMSLAHEAARGVIERMQDTAFGSVYATYNADPADDPGGAGTAPGRTFSVPGMTLQANDADGFVGDIVFPEVAVGGVPRLSESVVDARWGMPRDLNGDGVITAGAITTGYMILPVRVRIQWRGVSGNRSIELDHVFISH
jgi:hypothetical protein